MRVLTNKLLSAILEEHRVLYGYINGMIVAEDINTDDVQYMPMVDWSLTQLSDWLEAR